MIKEDIKFQNSSVFEGMTSIRAILKSNDEKINTRKINMIYYDKEKLHKISKEVAYLRAVSGKYGFQLIESDAEFLSTITLGNSHGGIVAETGDRTIPYLADCEIEKNGFYAMIQGIEDPYNFGYALRSLYAAGCSGIILDERNWLSAAGVVCRSSAGASELFPAFISEPKAAVDFFKSRAYTVVSADEKTTDTLGECELKLPLLLIVGGEKRGISKEILSSSDKRVKINYAREFHASLSAASAVTMFAYEIMRQNK